jgi:cytochrome P450
MGVARRPWVSRLVLQNLGCFPFHVLRFTFHTQNIANFRRFNYVPFGGGAHLCPGQQFAITEVLYTMVRLLQTFSDIKAGDDSVWAEGAGLAVSVKPGCKVKLTRA